MYCDCCGNVVSDFYDISNETFEYRILCIECESQKAKIIKLRCTGCLNVCDVYSLYKKENYICEMCINGSTNEYDE